MICYQIGNHSFKNQYECFLYGSQHAPHEFPKFCVFDEEFSKFDWSIEPIESFQTLCDIRAHQLRKKYDILVFAFSGGTDSITVYNTFKRNNIHIDEIVTSYNIRDDAYPKENTDWVAKNHYDSHTTITILERLEFITKYNCWNSDEWLLNLRFGLNRFELTLPGPEILHHYAEKFQGKNWGLITGYEKPHLVYENSKWYLTHLDKVHTLLTGGSNIEAFFISGDLPALHAKQAHMLKRYLENKVQHSSQYWSFNQKTREDYYLFAAAIGRDVEITLGASYIQKVKNSAKLFDNHKNTINGNLENNQRNAILLESLRDKSDYAFNYIKGWAMLQSDKTLVSYLHKHKLLDLEQSIIDYNGIFGRKYLLG